MASWIKAMTMKKKIKLSVTVATYNRVHLLQKSLEALVRQSLDKEKYEIIICDSESEDGTKDLIQEFKLKYNGLAIKHVNTVNVLAAKRNIGIANAVGEVVVFFDDDCIPEFNCLEIYFGLFIDRPWYPRKTVLCGEVRFPIKWVKSSNYYRFRDSRHFGAGKRDELKCLNFKTIVVMNMAFYKDEFIATVKNVNESFKGYGCEDQDLGWELEAHGFSIERCDAKIIHNEESASIVGYEKKIFHTARDGMTTLLSENPEAVKAISSIKLLDESYPFNNKLTSNFYKILRFGVFHQGIASFFAKVMVKTDRNVYFYSPIIYRYILGCAYIRGVHARGKRPKNADTWYE